jgi:hypothetical protein
MSNKKNENIVSGLHEITDACHLLIDVIANLMKGVSTIMAGMEVENETDPRA